MTLITLFSAPKAFTDPHIATIQKNAIRSWTRLDPEITVVLIGYEAGQADTAAELGVTHLPEVGCNAWGTPLVSSIFARAREQNRSPLLAYVNADILLLPDFVAAARRVMEQAARFLVAGRRWDLEIREQLDFGPGWPERLLAELNARGRRHAPAGSDYFIFPRECFLDIPDFAVGRAGWDNWMIYEARRRGWDVIDASEAITAIHQDHDYQHLPDGEPHYTLAESDLNRKLAGGRSNMYILLDANRRLDNGRIQVMPLSLARLLRKFEIWLTPAEVKPQGPLWMLARRIRRLRRTLHH